MKSFKRSREKNFPRSSSKLDLDIRHNNLLIFLTETQYNIKGKMMSCFLALMALDFGEIKPILERVKI